MIKILSSTKIQLLIITLLTFVAYSNIFQNQFVIDDQTFVVNWQTKNNFSNIGQLLAGDVPEGHQGVYRPLRSVIYVIYYQIFGTSPFGYHLHSLLIHLAATILVYFLALKIFSNLKSSIINHKSLAFISALLFGLHPVHTETITYISSAMESAGLVFFLASFYLFLRMRYFLSVVLAGLAFFTTEFTLTLPLVILFYEFMFYFKRRVVNWILPLGGMTVLAVVYVFIRFLALHITTRGPYLADSIYLTALTMIKVFVKYLSLTILPINLANNHIISKGIEAFVYRGYNQDYIRAQTLFDLSIILSLVILIATFFMAIKAYKKYPLITFAIGWFFITLLPVSEIIPQGSVMNEKFLYLPSFGFCLIFTIILFHISNRFRNYDLGFKNIRKSYLLNLKSGIIFVPLTFLIALFYGYLTFQRNNDWHDNISLWSKDVTVDPTENAYAYFQLGNAYVETGDTNKAVENYQHSFQINPHFSVALASVARAYEIANKQDLAESFYQQVLTQDPYFWEGYRNLSYLYIRQQKFDLAKEQLNRLIQIYPSYTPATQLLNSLEAK